MEWHEAIDKVKPYLFKIKTPNGYGTGFQIFYPGALRVVEEALRRLGEGDVGPDAEELRRTLEADLARYSE